MVIPPSVIIGQVKAGTLKVLGTFDGVYASSLQRAADTAAIIAESIGVGPVQLLDDLMENAFGPWQGLTIAEIEESWPGYLAAHRRPDGAEPTADVLARALRALRTIATFALQPDCYSERLCAVLACPGNKVASLQASVAAVRQLWREACRLSSDYYTGSVW